MRFLLIELDSVEPDETSFATLVGRLEAEHTQIESIAHEICNELNVVALEADVIQLAVGCGESAQVDESVARIHQRCSALAAAIRKLQHPDD